MDKQASNMDSMILDSINKFRCFPISPNIEEVARRICIFKITRCSIFLLVNRLTEFVSALTLLIDRK